MLDELPSLAAATPGLPSVVQGFYDRIGPGACGAPLGHGGASRGDKGAARPGVNELRRLEHLRDLLTAAGHDAAALSAPARASTRVMKRRRPMSRSAR
ncbi:MAG TPA: hypothetical protein VF062_13515 [Candidatus Limnocylindrales bacterium]